MKKQNGARRSVFCSYHCTKVLFCAIVLILRKGKESDREEKSPGRVFRSRGHIISASKTVSRVLYLTVIYLDVPLPARSSHPGSGRASLSAPIPVLLRIEFTASRCSHVMGELLPRLSTLARERNSHGRYISVALFLRALWAGSTRYPCPVEPDFPHDRPFGLATRLSVFLAQLLY